MAFPTMSVTWDAFSETWSIDRQKQTNLFSSCLLLSLHQSHIKVNLMFGFLHPRWKCVLGGIRVTCGINTEVITKKGDYTQKKACDFIKTFWNRQHITCTVPNPVLFVSEFKLDTSLGHWKREETQLNTGRKYTHAYTACDWHLWMFK